MKVRTVLIAVLVVAGGLGSAAPASAHRMPADCNSNEFDVRLSRDKFTVRNGETINYTITLDNLSSGARGPGGEKLIACDVSNITVRLQLPSSTGQPDPNSQIVVANAAYAAEQGFLQFGPFPYKVNANPGVTRL